MECYSEQTLALFVDGELPADEAHRVREHLVACHPCRELMDALRAENRSLSDSLHEVPEEAPGRMSFSHLRHSWVWGDMAALAAVLALAAIGSAWIDKLRIPEALEWLNPFSTNGMMNVAFSISDYLAQGGAAMLVDYAAVVGGLLFILGGALVMQRQWRVGPYLLVVLLLLSLPTVALERRHGESVTVTANETVEDTLLVSGNTVRVEGVINGDLLVFARTLEVRGDVKGDVVSFAKRTEVSGAVEGRIYNFSQSLDLEGEVGHSIYGWTQSLRVDSRGHVGEGIIVGASDVTLDGDVKRGVTMFAANADVSGSIGRDLTMAGRTLTLSDGARVGGNLIARVRRVADVHIANEASIVGKRDIQVRVRKSQFARPRFYLHQAIWIAAAMLVGWLGLLLLPAFFEACPQAVSAGWRSLGLGIGVLAATPLVIIVACITLVGIPLALMLLAAYVAAIYLAKIWVGALLGRILLKPAGATKRDWLLGLLVGLLILTALGFIPHVGAVVRFAVVCLGLGAFAWQLYRSLRPAVTVP